MRRASVDVPRELLDVTRQILASNLRIEAALTSPSRGPRDEADDPLPRTIHAEIGSIAFQTVELVTRADRDQEFKARLVAAGVRHVTAIALGRRLSRLARRGAVGGLQVQRIGRDGVGTLWAVVRTIDDVNDADAASDVIDSIPVRQTARKSA